MRLPEIEDAGWPVPSSPRPSLALLVLSAACSFVRPINHDVAWYLSGTGISRRELY